MKKKMISALLTMGMIVGLTACSGGASEEGTGSGDEIVLEFPSWQATEPGFQEFWGRRSRRFLKETSKKSLSDARLSASRKSSS